MSKAEGMPKPDQEREPFLEGTLIFVIRNSDLISGLSQR